MLRRFGFFVLFLVVATGCGPAPDGTGGLSGLVAGDQAGHQPINLSETIQFNEGGTPIKVYGNYSYGELNSSWERGYETRGFIAFDASTVPADVATVELELYCEASKDSEFPLELKILALDESWAKEAYISGIASQLPSWPKSTNMATGEVTSTKAGWVRFDITSMVERWRSDPSTNFGLLVAGPRGHQSIVSFYVGGDNAPRLRLMKQ